MPRLKIYTKSYCPYCIRAMSLLQKSGIADFDEISIDGREMAMRQKLFELTGGRWDVPQIFVDDRYIGDDDDLSALIESGKLRRLLDAS